MVNFVMLTGPHGAGKTTLIELLIERLGKDREIKFIPSVAGRVIKENGYTATENMSFSNRLEVQTKIVKEWQRVTLETLRGAGINTIVIADRSPIDSLAYMMTDVHRELTLVESNQLLDYDLLCKNIFHQLRRDFQATTLFIPPWKEHRALEESTTERGESKAPCGGYACHHEYLIRGILGQIERGWGVNEWGYGHANIKYIDSLDLESRYAEVIEKGDMEDLWLFSLHQGDGI